MHKFIVSICALLAFCLPSHPAAAQNPTLFSIGPATFRADGLSGYCLPNAELKAIEQLMAAADTMNVTLLTMVRCDDAIAPLTMDEYFILKAPKTELFATLTQEQLFEGLSEEFGNPQSEVNMLDGKVMDEVSETYTNLLNTELKVDGTINPAGIDDVCGYLAGVLELSSDGETIKASAAVCLTIAKNKLLSVNYYAPGETEADVRSAMAKAKDIAKFIRATNSE